MCLKQACDGDHAMPDHLEATLTVRTRRLMRLRQLSSAMAVLSVVIAVLLIGLMVLYWAKTPWDELLAVFGITAPAPASEPLLRIGGAAIALLPLAALTLGLV